MTGLWDDTASVVVTPLEPPFSGKVLFFEFEGNEKALAVSEDDGHRIKAMLSGAPKGRSVVLAAAEDGVRIRVSVSQ